MHSEHFRDNEEKTQQAPELVHGEHSITAASPKAETRKTKPLRRLVEEGLLTQYVGIVTTKNDRAQPPADVHNSSFSLRDED
jgi:hypothetical protein